MENSKCRNCCISMDSCVHSRRCFMSGEHCFKQPNIQRERRKMHDSDKFKIKAFVIMNFSDMSDVVYKWRIKPFIESLSKYLYFEGDKLYCSISDEDEGRTEANMVKEIEVVRSDSDPASNYVVCSRICQQMQIADLVVVDVTSQNANVFYEFGMAVALGKLILPICYSESFYKIVIPEALKENIKSIKNKMKNGEEMEEHPTEHHIGRYPWRKDLFEYYGIRYKQSSSSTGYIAFDEAVKSDYGFSDNQYNRFPYDQKLENDSEKIGETIYNQLLKEYNNAKYEDNTLVVYTMDGFLNEDQAGLCMVNFYNKIVKQMQREKCFCGERVGALVQGNVIPESEKDVREKLDIAYSIGEIIQIGTNQATYLAAEEKIKSDDNWANLLRNVGNTDESAIELFSQQKRAIESFIKNHIKNRAIRIYPNNPVFVDRMKSLLYSDLIKSIDGAFYLYYVMLRTLRHTNEIVVDVSNNCLQSLFWLGAAHGRDIHAITVMHEKTDAEKKGDTRELEKENRYVFDVAGLWMAILRKNDTEGFYAQLAAAQSGIERHSKLMLPNSEYAYYRKQLKEYLFDFDEDDKTKINIIDLKKIKDSEEAKTLESYYRDRFWTPMLGYNRLSIYLSHRNEKGDNEEPRLGMSKWDFDTVSVLSHYLSKRKIIGEYSLISAPEKRAAGEEKLNFICVGSESRPLDKSLSQYIFEQIKDVPSKYEDMTDINIIHERHSFSKKETEKYYPTCVKMFKGFARIEKKESGESSYSDDGIFAHHPQTHICAKCSRLNSDGEGGEVFSHVNEIEKKGGCQLTRDGNHMEVAQLILWRENPGGSDDQSYFWVGIIGSSGPATYALSSLFVSEEQTETHFGFKNTANEEMLSELQRYARQKFMDMYYRELDKKIQEHLADFDEINGMKKDKYRRLIEYTVIVYLKTVLYRYFFPFLSETDIERIYSGMYMLINSMRAAKVSPFTTSDSTDENLDNKINEIITMIPGTLRETLKSFRGLEVFYKVVVRHILEKPETKKDVREIREVKIVTKDKTDAYINYFFI